MAGENDGDASGLSLMEDPDGETATTIQHVLAETLASDVWVETAYNLVDTICQRDISRVDGVARSPQHARVIMQEYARVSSTQAKHAGIRRDLAARGTELSRDTVDSYITKLRELYVIQDLPAWTPSLRARSHVTRTPARHYCDPSLAVAALGTSPDPLLRDMATFGLLFEGLCVRDLRAYAGGAGRQRVPLPRRERHRGRRSRGASRWRIRALRGQDGHVGDRRRRREPPRACAQGGRVHHGSPRILCRHHPGGYAYRREDGVLVVPVTCLAP